MRERGILSRFLYVIALNRALRNIKENPLRRVFFFASSIPATIPYLLLMGIGI